jgi:hypothetical protein
MLVGEVWAAKSSSGLTSVGLDSTGSPSPLKSLSAATFTLPQEFQNLPSENTFGQRREMPRPEEFKYPNMGKANDYRRRIEELERSIQQREQRLGMPFSGTYY